jgi:Ca-activated chloride channel family protein
MAETMQAEKTLSPYFFVQSGDPGTDQLPLKSTAVAVNIAGVIADVKVTQTYTNTGTRPIEAIYVFPASTRAAVYGMKMTIGARTIIAEIREREQARQEYEEAKRVGKSASLLEQQRPNVFQMNVANILPGDEIKVELSYTELLVPTDGVYEFMYPTVVGPRYVGSAGILPAEEDAGRMPALPEQQLIGNPYLHEGEAPKSTFGITVALAAGLPVQEMLCSSHKVNINYEGTTLANVNLEEAEKYGGNRDFILQYRLSGGQIESGLLLYEGKAENFFLLMMQPPKHVTVDQIPQREYIFILDVSGSMHGFPLDTAKTLLTDLMHNIRPTDLFNILLFSFGSGLLSKQSLPATPEHVQQGMQFIRSQSGGGGTELLPALQRALSLPRIEGVSRTVIIVTDGYVAVEPEAFDLIRAHLGDANLFAFGIGSSVNRFLIEGMARVGMGEPFMVTKPEEASQEANKLRQYIQSPVLTQIKIDFDGLSVQEVEPISIPDVLAERPVIVFGKWTGQPTGKIIVRGLTGKQPYAYTVEVSTVKQLETNAALRYLWARHRIALLSDYNNLQKDDERVEAITDLGLKYNLLTAYTSFVAIDSEIRRKGEEFETIKQPLPLPQGVSEYAVGQGIGMPGMMTFAAPISPMMASTSMLRMSRGGFAETAKKFIQPLFSKEVAEISEEFTIEAEMLGIATSQGDVTLDDIVVGAGVQTEYLKNALQPIIEDLKKLYQQLLQKRPQTAGKIVVTFKLTGANRAKDVRIVTSELHQKTFEKYLIKQIEKFHFPPRADRSDVTISCTFVFEVV